jgi:pilus assembly protein CpaE
MAQHISILGSVDRQLEQMLRATGSRITTLPLAELSKLALSSSEQPDVVLLDVRSDSQLPPGVAALRRQHPHTGVVIIASRLDPSLMLEAMRAGVNECVTEPLTRNDLDAAIARVVRQQRSVVIGDAFAFIGAKGGVGTTTVAVNVATALTKTVGRGGVLLIDLHLAHGDAAVFLGAEPRFSVIDALENVQRSDEAFFRSLVVKTAAGVDLLASSERPMVGAVDGRSVKGLMDLATRLYRHVVLDVPRSDTTVLDSLDAAARLIVVANQELAAVRGAGRLATMLRQRYGVGKVSVVLSRYDATGPIGYEDVEKATGGKVKHKLPSEYNRVVEALNQGAPLVLGNHSALAGGLEALAHDLAGVESGAGATERRGLFGRLTGRK